MLLFCVQYILSYSKAETSALSLSLSLSGSGSELLSRYIYKDVYSPQPSSILFLERIMSEVLKAHNVSVSIGGHLKHMTLFLLLKRKKKLFSFLQMSRVMRKPTFWFSTRSDTNQAVQLQKIARGLKFWI